MDEKSKLIMELAGNNSKLLANNQSLMEKLDKLTLLVESIKSRLDESERLNKEKDSQIRALQKQISDLLEMQELSRKERFGSKSQKKKSSPDPPRSREEEKDDFDGTPDLPENSSSIESHEAQDAEVPNESKPRPYRHGLTYKTMRAERKIVHHSDMGRLPEGAVLINKSLRYSYEQVTTIVEHQYELLTYKTSDGRVHTGYFPTEGEPEIIDVFPGTHASSGLMAHLSYNRFVMDTPLYREHVRFHDERMRACRSTLTNWLEKGGRHIESMIGYLKDICMDRDSILNCDETWCRVRVGGKYRKKYIWCLVNSEARIAIYYYEDGSRSREVLKRIIGGREISALQSDGYNVYMYIDKHLDSCAHLCCMAHARAKFKYAYEQGGDRMALEFLNCIGELYRLEREYKEGHLTPEQTGLCRRSEKTKSIVIRLRSLLDSAMSPGHPPRGILMDRAVNYLYNFWKQLFAYLDDGRYSIDNSVAEQNIRPLAGERKNSLFFGSGRMASISAAYHTIISTCKMQGISALEYLKKFFFEIVRGRRDYENL
ncbi:MAG: IS66 family transposase, partial [Prevotellaceae bacterium]|nr:IS66 family transposase [Prevotellaceae bacterium]